MVSCLNTIFPHVTFYVFFLLLFNPHMSVSHFLHSTSDPCRGSCWRYHVSHQDIYVWGPFSLLYFWMGLWRSLLLLLVIEAWWMRIVIGLMCLLWATLVAKFHNLGRNAIRYRHKRSIGYLRTIWTSMIWKYSHHFIRISDMVWQWAHHKLMISSSCCSFR